MPPPQLSRNAPVSDVFHPIAVHILEFGGVQTNAVVHHILQSRLCEVFHFEKPLRTQARFHDGISPFTTAHFGSVVLRAKEISGFFKVLGDGLSGDETIRSNMYHGFLIEPSRVIQQIDDRQGVPQTDLVIVQVVRRGHLQATCSEFWIDIFIGQNRYAATDQGNDSILPDEVPVAFILRMDTNSGICHDRLWPHRGNRDMIFCSFDRVIDVVKLGVYLLVDDFIVG
ncbi:MAG: Uncharacterised protein [Flavobacteriia bacterium]|nr:MAG: Uncharacterised protein [Flavobacteriia bacterium]